MKRLFGAVALFFLWSFPTGTAVAQTATSPSVWSWCSDGEDNSEPKPSEIEVGCSGKYTLVQLTWSSWGPKSATGRGVEMSASSYQKIIKRNVTVLLDLPKSCGSDGVFYQRLRTYTGTGNKKKLSSKYDELGCRSDLPSAEEDETQQVTTLPTLVAAPISKIVLKTDKLTKSKIKATAATLRISITGTPNYYLRFESLRSATTDIQMNPAFEAASGQPLTPLATRIFYDEGFEQTEIRFPEDGRIDILFGTNEYSEPLKPGSTYNFTFKMLKQLNG
jgi:hypothetical protein